MLFVISYVHIQSRLKTKVFAKLNPISTSEKKVNEASYLKKKKKKIQGLFSALYVRLTNGGKSIEQSISVGGC